MCLTHKSGKAVVTAVVMTPEGWPSCSTAPVLTQEGVQPGYLPWHLWGKCCLLKFRLPDAGMQREASLPAPGEYLFSYLGCLAAEQGLLSVFIHRGLVLALVSVEPVHSGLCTATNAAWSDLTILNSPFQ